MSQRAKNILLWCLIYVLGNAVAILAGAAFATSTWSTVPYIVGLGQGMFSGIMWTVAFLASGPRVAA